MNYFFLQDGPVKIPVKETKKTTPVQWKHEERRPQGSGDGTSSQRKEETVIILKQLQANSVCCMASKSIYVNSLKKDNKHKARRNDAKKLLSLSLLLLFSCLTPISGLVSPKHLEDNLRSGVFVFFFKGAHKGIVGRGHDLRLSRK